MASVSLVLKPRRRISGVSLSWYGLIPEKTPIVSTTGFYTIDGSGVSWGFFIEALADRTGDTTYNIKHFETPLLPAGKHQLVVTYNGNLMTAPLSLDYLIIQNASVALASSSSSNPDSTTTGGLGQNTLTDMSSLSGTMSVINASGSSDTTPNATSAIISPTLYPTSISGGGPTAIGSGHVKKLNTAAIAGSISGSIGLVILVGLVFALFSGIKKTRQEGGKIQDITPTPFQHSAAVDLRFRVDGTKVRHEDAVVSMPSKDAPQYNIL